MKKSEKSSFFLLCIVFIAVLFDAIVIWSTMPINNIANFIYYVSIFFVCSSILIRIVELLTLSFADHKAKKLVEYIQRDKMGLPNITSPQSGLSKAILIGFCYHLISECKSRTIIIKSVKFESKEQLALYTRTLHDIFSEFSYNLSIHREESHSCKTGVMIVSFEIKYRNKKDVDIEKKMYN